jgi:low affinity Fe/Cu permease
MELTSVICILTVYSIQNLYDYFKYQSRFDELKSKIERLETTILYVKNQIQNNK